MDPDLVRLPRGHPGIELTNGRDATCRSTLTAERAGVDLP